MSYMIMMGPSIGMPSYRAGKLAILGIADTKPLPQLPEIPTIAAAVPGYASSVGFGLAAPATMPRELVARINADVQQILRDPEFRAGAREHPRPGRGVRLPGGLSLGMHLTLAQYS